MQRLLPAGRLIFPVLVVQSVLALPSAAGQDAAPPEKSAFQKAYSAESKGHQAKYAGLVAELKAAKADAKPEIRARIEQLNQSTAARIIELVRQQPSEEETYNALLWLAVKVNHGPA